MTRQRRNSSAILAFQARDYELVTKQSSGDTKNSIINRNVKYPSLRRLSKIYLALDLEKLNPQRTSYDCT